MDIYAENILDHFRHPHNAGALRDATIDHEEENLACGDELHVWLRLEKVTVRHPEEPSRILRDGPHGPPQEDVRSAAGRLVEDNLLEGREEKNHRIAQIGWTGTGCAISQASMSILSEELMGKTDTEIHNLTKDDVYTLLGVPIGPRRFKCALMSLHTAKNALRKVKGLPPQSWIETVSLNEE